jgi:hypothetical protein
MADLNRLFKPLRQAAQAFFRSDVTLRRDAEGLRLALEDRPPKGEDRTPSKAEAEARRKKRELELVLSQLAEVLDAQPDTRATLRHLVFVEHALRKKGMRALRKLPLDVLQRALDQFEGLVTNWSPEGLANLRSKMAVAVIERETGPADDEAGNGESGFDLSGIEAVLDTPAVEAAKAIEKARQPDFADSTIERLALEFGVGRPVARLAPESLELQGELGSPSAKAARRSAGAQPEMRITQLDS